MTGQFVLLFFNFEISKKSFDDSTYSLSNFWPGERETSLYIHYLANTSTAIARKYGEIEVWSLLCCSPENSSQHKSTDKLFYPCLIAYFFDINKSAKN